MLYPQNDDRIVAIDSVTSLHPVYTATTCTVYCTVQRTVLNGRTKTNSNSNKLPIEIASDTRCLFVCFVRLLYLISIQWTLCISCFFYIVCHFAY